MWLLERERVEIFCLIVWCCVGLWFWFGIVVMSREVGNCGKISVGF